MQLISIAFVMGSRIAVGYKPNSLPSISANHFAYVVDESLVATIKSDAFVELIFLKEVYPL